MTDPRSTPSIPVAPENVTDSGPTEREFGDCIHGVDADRDCPRCGEGIYMEPIPSEGEARPTPVEPEAPIDHLRYHREEPCDCEPPGDWLDARGAPQRGPVISVTHSCGDCGFLGQEPDFDRHHSRVWHRGVKKIGLEAALDSRLVNSPDARRAIAIFREGARP